MVRGDEGEERLEIEIALRPGHGAALLFRDLDSDRLVVPQDERGLIAPGLADVLVVADGQVVARSDSDGLAVLDLARAPERLEFTRPGWRVAGEHTEDSVRYVFMTRE